MKGFNAALIAYGQTGSGKTYTMLVVAVAYDVAVPRCGGSPVVCCVCPRLRMGPPDPTSRRPALILDGPSRGIIPRMMEELFARLSIMDTVDVRGVWAACPGFHTCNHACEVARWKLMCVASMWKSTWRSFETCSCHRKRTSGSAATCSRVARSSQMRPRCVPKQCRPTSRAPLPLTAVNAGPGGERG